jgi:hypothetical protein
MALSSVWGSGPSDVWAVGGGSGFFMHWDGTAWSSVGGGNVSAASGVWGSSSNDVWAVGPGYDGVLSAFMHWDGSAWSGDISPLSPLGATVGVGGSGPSDVWAVGANGTILHH